MAWRLSSAQSLAVVVQKGSGLLPVQTCAFNNPFKPCIGFRTDTFGIDCPGVGAHVVDFTAKRAGVLEQGVASFNPRAERVGNESVGNAQLVGFSFGVVKDVPFVTIQLPLCNKAC